MKRSPLLSFAAISLALCASAQAATRPAYGGTLRVESSASLSSLDPAQEGGLSADAGLRSKVASLLFDGLVRLDESGTVQPALATSWRHDADFRRWEFVVREGVKMHNGSRLDPRLVVMSLAAANGAWKVRLAGNAVVVESESPMPELLAELARPRYSIVGRGIEGALIGTGPFRVAEFQPGKRLLLRANEDWWAGRPYADAIEITFARSYRDQSIDLQADRADVIEVSADQARRAAQEGQRLATSSPVELLAIVFLPKVQDQRVREAVSAAIDRASLHGILLQKQGEPAASLLPQWVSGYAFLFPTARNEAAPQPQRTGSSAQALTLAYDWSDTVAKSVAERVAVNARDAGVTVQVFGENLGNRPANADMRLVRVVLPSARASVALAAMAADLGYKEQAQQIVAMTSPESLYSAERALLRDFVVVPLAYVPEVHALGPRVRNWVAPRQGGWPLENVSLVLEKP
ncbi:MAG TPA: ABC transporter substrate-binding protein [Terriglobales bacterium]|nr:ABC transporter substrate-binding protein [Terriglobales bacterium]